MSGARAQGRAVGAQVQAGGDPGPRGLPPTGACPPACPAAPRLRAVHRARACEAEQFDV